MFVPVSAEKLLNKISEFKANNSPAVVLTNFFNAKLENKEWFLSEQSCGLFFVSRDSLVGLSHYFFMASSGCLNGLKLNFLADTKVVSEFVFNGGASDVVIQHYEKLGFNMYAHLKKMSFLSKADQFVTCSEHIELCDMSDFGYLRYILDSHFDAISERCPSNEELNDALNSGSVFKYVDGGAVLGFYWADSKKYLSELRYLFVDGFSRGGGIGKALFEHHLYVTQPIKKNQLWVLENNIPAIALYQKYGFQFESLQDLIFLKV